MVKTKGGDDIKCLKVILTFDVALLFDRLQCRPSLEKLAKFVAHTALFCVYAACRTQSCCYKTNIKLLKDSDGFPNRGIT